MSLGLAALSKAKKALAIGGFPQGRGAVCFTWDDAYEIQMDIARAATARGQAHTFLPHTDVLDTAGRLTSGDLLTLVNLGHEVGSSGESHTAWTSLSVADRTAEADNSKTTIESSAGSGEVTTFAYPYGTRSSTTDEELYGRYDRVFTAGGLTAQKWGYELDSRNSFLLGRIALADDGSTNTFAKNLISQAAVTNRIVSFYSHDMSLATAVDLMDHARDLGVPCVTTRQAFPGAAPLLNASFEDELGDEWSRAGSDASQLMERVAETPADGIAGSYALKLTTTTDSSYVYATQFIPVEPERKYLVSGRYKVAITSGSGDVVVRPRQRDYEGNHVSATESSALTATTWTKFSHEFTTAAAATHVLLDLKIESATAVAFFDHLHFGPREYGAFG